MTALKKKSDQSICNEIHKIIKLKWDLKIEQSQYYV